MEPEGGGVRCKQGLEQLSLGLIPRGVTVTCVRVWLRDFGACENVCGL